MPADPEAGVTWYLRALKGGYINAANNLGTIYERGLLGSNDLVKAAYYYQYAAERASLKAQINLGQLYEQQGNNQKAEEWLRKAAETGDAWAEYLLADHYEYPQWDKTGPKWSLPKDLPQAFHWYSRAAGQNQPQAQYRLGLMYLTGQNVEMDEARGLDLIRAAADQDDTDALRELAGLYSRGVGEPRNAADRPIPLLVRAGAWDELVFRYQYGLGTQRDLFMAARYYCHGAMTHSRGYETYSLDDKIQFYPRKRSWTMRGRQTPDTKVDMISPMEDLEPTDDVLLALSLYLNSATGNGTAALQIGDQYLAGQDTPKSAAWAWVWYSLAAQDGSTGAPARIAAVERQLSQDELKTARQNLADQTAELAATAKELKR